MEIREDDTDLEVLDVALDRLEQQDPVKASVVKLRYYVGLTNVQTAETLGIWHATAERYWA